VEQVDEQVDGPGRRDGVPQARDEVAGDHQQDRQVLGVGQMGGVLPALGGRGLGDIRDMGS
jgi:hypothetical protein